MLLPEDCNMGKILLVTNIYPLPSALNEGTPVCHYFARDWAKLGYDVSVIHIQAVYPTPLYWVAKLLKKWIAAKTGSVVYARRESEVTKFEWDGVTVYRVPSFKWWPHSKFTRRTIQKLKVYIDGELAKREFKPDYICGHFPNPMLELLSYYGKKYHAKTCYISHGDVDIIRNVYRDNYRQLLSEIEVFGFRSEPIKVNFEKIFGKKERSFICYSGVPENYVADVSKVFDDTIHRFCFLGSLYELKRVKDTLEALHKAFPNHNFIFDIIGEGQERENLEQLAKQLGISEQVHFYGQQPRDEAQKIVSKSDYFIMVSKREAFGLVYLEAMGKGLICIGTKGQGIDGVIRDGENGFLCESCNPDKLAKVIQDIVSLNKDEKIRISKAAQRTTAEMTDLKMAQYYIDSVKLL